MAFCVQLASGDTARLLSHLAGARQMSAGVKLARCHSDREGQNLLHKLAKSSQDTIACGYFRQNTAHLLKMGSLPPPHTQIFLRHLYHLQPCSSPQLTQPRQRRRQERGPAQPRAGKRKTKSPEMPRTQKPARLSAETLKKDRGLRELRNPANRSQVQDARTQVTHFHGPALSWCH